MNIKLRDVRGRIVVLWDCQGCGISGFGLDYGKVSNDGGPNGDGSYDNTNIAFEAFKSRSALVGHSAREQGWFENSAARTVWDTTTDLGMVVGAVGELLGESYKFLSTFRT